MPPEPFEYAVLRVVPRVERGERLNVGVVLQCRPRRFLGGRVELGEAKLEALQAMAPDLDAAALQAHLDGIRRIVDGDPAGGPIAKMAPPERFHWLTSPASTIIQPSEVHTGLTEDPARALDDLFEKLVG
jgi:Protein of unknown function (DUF3037)